MDFICFSVNNWEKRRARKQQFMLHFSMRPDVGKVIYVEPPVSLLRLIFTPFCELNSQDNRNRWKRALAFKPEEFSKKIFVYTPLFYIPFSFRFSLIHNLNLFVASCILKRQLRVLGCKDFILWFYHPLDYKLLDWFKDRRLACFDWAEEWADYFIEYTRRGKKMIRRLEHRLIAGVDLVFVVSKKLFADAKALNPRSTLIHDGTIPELFDISSEQVPEDLKNIKHPILGYGGTFSDLVDISLVKELSRRFPESSLVFVGNIQYDRVDVSSLKSLPNVFFLGGKPYEELPRYLLNFDVCILPYFYEFSRSPTKIYDYLATGKPIVSTELPELDEMRPWVKMAKTYEEFVAKVKESLSEHRPDLQRARIEKAKENSWSARADQIMQIIYNYLNREDPSGPAAI